LGGVFVGIVARFGFIGVVLLFWLCKSAFSLNQAFPVFCLL
jgi:hypothetical protein